MSGAGADTKEQLIDPRTSKLYDFSLRWGIERDPLLMDRLTGPHGLKRQVPEEFLDLGQGEPGTVWYASFLVNEPQGSPARLAVGSRAQYTAWVNGIEQLRQERSYPVERMGPWRLPVYKTPLLTKQVALSPGVNLVTLRLVQPEAQRLRAFAFLCRGDVPAPAESLALRWFSSPGTLLPDPTPGKTQPVGWYRFVAPPGLRGMRIVARGRIGVWVDGVEADVREFPLGSDGAQPYQVIVTRPSERSVMVAIRVEQERGCYAGAVFPEPVSLECGPGKAPAGDWSQLGLETYSGAAWYRKRVVLSGVGARTVLDLGSVFATAAVWVNGKQAGVCIAPPWRVDVTPFVRSGENLIEIQVANTLANHYSVGIPSLYVFPGQTRSGLSGPVRLLSY